MIDFNLIGILCLPVMTTERKFTRIKQCLRNNVHTRIRVRTVYEKVLNIHEKACTQISRFL